MIANYLSLTQNNVAYTPRTGDAGVAGLRSVCDDVEAQPHVLVGAAWHR